MFITASYVLGGTALRALRGEGFGVQYPRIAAGIQQDVGSLAFRVFCRDCKAAGGGSMNLHGRMAQLKILN